MNAPALITADDIIIMSAIAGVCVGLWIWADVRPIVVQYLRSRWER